MMLQQKTRVSQQTYLVLIRDGGLALAVAAALQDQLTLSGAGGAALVPATRDVGFGDSSRAYLRQAAGCGGRPPQVVALYEDGLLGRLEALGLCAYVGVPDNQDWRVLRWGSDAGAMLLPVATGSDLVDAVADYTPWHKHATATAALQVSRVARKPRLVHPGPLSRKLALAAVAAPLLTVGLPAAVAAAAPQSPAGPQPAAQAPPVSGIASSPVSIPAPGTPPAQVTAWWNSLSQDQKLDVTNNNPGAIGNLNGIPPTARDYANRQSLINALDPNNPNSLQNLIQNPQNTPAELNRLQTLLDGARALQQQIGLPDSPNLHDTAQPPPTVDVNTSNPVTVSDTAPTFLLNFDLNGLGHFSFSVGDTASAQNVTTFVPGMLTSMSAANVDWYGNAMVNLYNAANFGDATRSTAVVFWYGPGYNSPQGADARSADAAQAAAPSLQQFQAGVVSTNSDPSSLNLALVCHSYGGPVCGAATEGEGIYANSMTLLGTPGTGRNSAAELASGMMSADPNSVGGQGQVFASRNDYDIIWFAGGGNLIPGFAPNGWFGIGGHGMDPTNPQFDAKVFDSGPGAPGDFASTTPDFAFFSRQSHSLYMDPGSPDSPNPAFTSIVNIMLGNWTAITPPSRTINPPPREPMDDSGGAGTAAPGAGAPPTDPALDSPPPAPRVVDPDRGGGGAGGGAAGGVPGMTGTPSGPAATPPGDPPQDPAAGKQGNNAAPATPGTPTQTGNGDDATANGQNTVKTAAGPAADDGSPGNGSPGNGQTIVQAALAVPAPASAVDPPSGLPAAAPGAGGGGAEGVQGQPGTQSGPAVTPPSSQPAAPAPDAGGGGAGGGAAGGVQGLPGTPSGPAAIPSTPADPNSTLTTDLSVQEAAAQQAVQQGQQQGAQELAANEAAMNSSSIGTPPPIGTPDAAPAADTPSIDPPPVADLGGGGDGGD